MGVRVVKGLNSQAGVQSATLREDWHFILIGECQRAACALASGDDPPRVYERLLREAPPPTSLVEEQIYLGAMFKLALGRAEHSTQNHTSTVLSALGRIAPGKKATARDRWIASRTADIIVRDLAKPLNVHQIAAELGCHETTLRRAFEQWAGVSLRTAHVRARVREAIRLFNDGLTDVLAVARCVGYRSEKNFYRAFRIVAGMTPSQMRRLPAGSITIEIVDNALGFL